LDDLQDLRHHLHGLEVSFEGRSKATARRAAGFHELHQAAIMKESAASPPDHEWAAGQSSQSKGKAKAGNAQAHAEQVRLNAAAELRRLQNLPELKWTWGADLSKDEVLKLMRPVTSDCANIHSGYVDSLASGLRGEWSERSLSASSEPHNVSDLGEDVTNVPELHPDQYPVHFTYPPLRHFFSDPPVARAPTQPSSWLHPPPNNYINFPPPPNPLPAAISHRTVGLLPLGARQVFSDSSDEGSITRTIGGHHAFSDFSDDEKAGPAGPPSALSNSGDEEDALGACQAFSDMTDEEDGEALGACQAFSDFSDNGKARPASPPAALSNSGDEEDLEGVIGARQAFSDMTDDEDGE
jgi:hypothetical protein